jgi:folate-dependent tRNA-U54 methylase TrmFO/GidA
LSNFDSEHKENWKAKKAEANLTKIEDDPSVVIPLGPLMITTHAPSDSDVEDKDEMKFTGAWFTPVVPDDDGNDDVCFFPEVYCCPI